MSYKAGLMKTARYIQNHQLIFHWLILGETNDDASK